MLEFTDPTVKWTLIGGAIGTFGPKLRGDKPDPISGLAVAATAYLIASSMQSKANAGSPLPPSPEGPRGNRPTR